MPSVDPQVYYDAARACQQLAHDLEAPVNALRGSLDGCGGMAGHYDAVVGWAREYDQHARSFDQYATNYVGALYHFGDLLYAAGHNWAMANWKADRNPNKGDPPTKPAPAFSPTVTVQQTVPSAGSNGKGLDTNIPGLLEQVGLPIPDGDSRKLGVAADAWKAFAAHATVMGAEARLRSVAGMFDELQARDVTHINEHFTTLGSGAHALAAFPGSLAVPVADHRQALTELRGGVDSALSDVKRDLALAVGFTVVAMTIELVATAGLAALGPEEATAAVGTASGAAAVARAAKILHDLVRDSRLLIIVGSAAAGCLAFKAVESLDIRSAIAGILSLAIQQIQEGGQVSATRYEDLPLAPEVPEAGLTDAGEKYVRGRHFPGGAELNPTKSTFLEGEDPDALVEASDGITARGPNDDGNYEREVDAGRVVGNLSPRAGGRPTTKYKVITDRWGAVISMFPVE
ncbi:hypothetical protein ACWDSJ_26620 [Nocardia sp. NPDC003482]